MVPELRVEPTTFETTAMRGKCFTATPPMKLKFEISKHLIYLVNKAISNNVVVNY
jgi:hypothetical protein